MRYILFFVIYSCFVTLHASDQRGDDFRVLIEDFSALQPQHITINLERINSVAIELLSKHQLNLPDWTDVLPQGLDTNSSIEYMMGLISIDFCHWGLKETPEGIRFCDFYTTDDQGETVRGSAAMTALAKRAYENGTNIFDAHFMQKVTADSLRPHFIGFDSENGLMEIPLLAKRALVMNEIGEILLKKWQGSFSRIFYTANSRAFNNGEGFVELLIRDFPRFRDEYVYQGKKIGIYKLAQLAVMALQSALSLRTDFQKFKDCSALTVCADYQLPRSLRALGILEYDVALAHVIDQDKLIPAGSAFEIELRMATVFAGWKLKTKINEHLANEGKPSITSQEIDYLLWSHGRQLGRNSSKHHLTQTIMY